MRALTVALAFFALPAAAEEGGEILAAMGADTTVFFLTAEESAWTGEPGAASVTIAGASDSDATMSIVFEIADGSAGTPQITMTSAEGEKMTLGGDGLEVELEKFDVEGTEALAAGSFRGTMGADETRMEGVFSVKLETAQ